MVYVPAQSPGRPVPGDPVMPPPTGPQPAAPPAMPVPHPRQPPPAVPTDDRSQVRTNRALKAAAVNRSVAERTQDLQRTPTPRPAAAPPTVGVTGGESPAEARAKLTCWTLAADLSRVLAHATLGHPADTQAALATMQEHARRMLGNSVAGGAMVGLAEQASHLIGNGLSPANVAPMVLLLGVQFVPPLAGPLDTALALIGGASAARSLTSAGKSLAAGDHFEAGREAAKGLLDAVLAKVAYAERGHAAQAMSAGKLHTLPVATLERAWAFAKAPRPAALKATLTTVMQECRHQQLAARKLLKPEHGSPSPALKLAHTSESTGKLNANQHEAGGHEGTLGASPQGRQSGNGETATPHGVAGKPGRGH